MEKDKREKKPKNFEDALESLEDIARSLESGELGLDESIEKYEEGMKLAKLCQEKLSEAERKIEILQKGKGGEVKKKEISVKEDSGEIEDEDEVQGSLL